MTFLTESNRIYIKDEQDRLLAEVTFPSISPWLVDVNHTFVDDSLRGQGIAGKLMEAVVSHLRETGQSCICTCSYAKKWFASHPEVSDVWKNEG